VVTLKRVWRAFCAGFWAAWVEAVPAERKGIGTLVVTVEADVTQFNAALDRSIAKLEQLRQAQVDAHRIEVPQ
jgi:hypothetical protein